MAQPIIQQVSPDIALLNYGATAHSSTCVSPAAALMGRQLRTKLPTLPYDLWPRQPIRKADRRTKDSYKWTPTKGVGLCHPMSQLKPGVTVLIKTKAEQAWDKEGKVVAAILKIAHTLSPHVREYCVGTESMWNSCPCRARSSFKNISQDYAIRRTSEIQRTSKIWRTRKIRGTSGVPRASLLLQGHELWVKRADVSWPRKLLDSGSKMYATVCRNASAEEPRALKWAVMSVCNNCELCCGQ